jgi:peroxiredoxin
MQHRYAVPLLLSMGLLALGVLDASSHAADRPGSALLQLTDDGIVAGNLLASDDASVLRWHAPAFVQPLQFPLAALKSVRWPVSGAPPVPKGDYCIELEGDDVLFGNLLALTADQLEIDSPRFGRLHLPRRQVRRFYRWSGAELVYFGPHGLSDWKELSAGKNWRDEGGPLATSQFDAALFGSPGLPEKAVIEVELAWKQKPDFVLELGVDELAKSTEGVFRIEVWDGELVLVGESKRDADLAALQKLPAGEGSARLQIYLDQRQGQAIVLNQSSQTMATLKIDPASARVAQGVRLINKNGDVRLQALRITRWNGTAPEKGLANRARLHRASGAVVYGELKAYDPKTKQFTLATGKEDLQIGCNDVTDIYLTPSAGPAEKIALAERKLRVVFRDGSRVSGTLSRIEDKSLTVISTGAKEPLLAPFADLRGLLSLRSDRPPDVPVALGKPGQLKLEGIALKGRLVTAAAGAANLLTWKPDLALSASPLTPGVAGEIVYREPPPPAPEVRDEPQFPRAQRAPGMAEAVGRFLFGEPTPAPATPTPVASGPKSLHLRSGDVVPCEVTGIDEQGVTFTSPLTAATRIPHAKIKSIELVSTRDAPQLNQLKRDRLLTLPRLQKDVPPTHLICSTNGDFLRGRNLEMNDKSLRVEVRLEVRTIPRDRVAQIIWLHADELTDRRAEGTKQGGADRRVQVLRGDRNRLTFALERSDAKQISGTSDVLAACRADLADVDMLYFGSAIEDSAAKLAYNLWKLHHATEPKVAEAIADDSPEGEPTGKSSPLVGQAAFVFKLPTLDGPDFDLASRKGKIVILDFWATWCGPCMQTAPLFEDVMREFAGRDVELIGVNMEEQPDLIKSVLERHKLRFRVALDRDGAIAPRYGVTAIPQTVVIDREGKIARLFVGGGKKTADALRKSIQELLEAKP